MTTLLAVAVQPIGLVTVTVYVPAVVGAIAAVVAAVLHAYVPPPDAVSVTLPPVQNVVEPVGVIVADAAGTAILPARPLVE